MLYNPDRRAIKIWYDPKTDRTIEGKQDKAICFDSFAEFECFRILNVFAKKFNYQLSCHKPLFFRNGDKTSSWKVDFTLKTDKTTLFVEYKSAFTLETSKKFKRDIKIIYTNMPNLARNIIICSKDDLVIKIDDNNVIYSVYPNKLVYNIEELLKR